MIPNFSYVIPGKLAGSGRPGRNDSLGRDFEHLVRRKIKVIVSLTETGLDQKQLERFSLRFLHVPVQDFSAPDAEQVEKCLCFIDECLAEDLPVLVHCGAGFGRTGTILACYLVHLGRTSEKAIEAIRKSRPGSIETQEQEMCVYIRAKVEEILREKDGNEEIR